MRARMVPEEQQETFALPKPEMHIAVLAEIAEAVMLTDSNADEVSRWINSVMPNFSFSYHGSLFLHWHRGDIPVPTGYWLVRDTNDKIVMCDSFRPEWIPDYVEERQ